MQPISRLIKAVAVALAVLSAAGAARAEMLCLPRASAVTELGSRYDEQVSGRGLVEGGRAMVEVFVSETGSWTIVLTDTGGRSCLVASGGEWSTVSLVLGDPA